MGRRPFDCAQGKRAPALRLLCALRPPKRALSFGADTSSAFRLRQGFVGQEASEPEGYGGQADGLKITFSEKGALRGGRCEPAPDFSPCQESACRGLDQSSGNPCAVPDREEVGDLGFEDL